MRTKPSAELTLFDLLSRLTFGRATAFLGSEGERLIAAGGQYEIDIVTQVKFQRDEFRLAVDHSTVTLAVSPAARASRAHGGGRRSAAYRGVRVPRRDDSQTRADPGYRADGTRIQGAVRGVLRT